jgi:two-component system sensor histidine kinase RegB
MESGEVAERGSAGLEDVPFSRMAQFLRLLAHDVRNDLNAVDLLTAYIRDLAAEPGVRGELDQLRTAIRYGSERMQRLSRAFQNPEPEKFPIPLRVLVENFQKNTAQNSGVSIARMRWKETPAEGVLSVDSVLLEELLHELVENALAFSAEDGTVEFRVEESASGLVFVVEQELAETLCGEPGEWGKQPFTSTRRGHYGLGLFRARRLVEALGGSLHFVAEPFRGVLQSRVEFGWEGGVR